MFRKCLTTLSATHLSDDGALTLWQPPARGTSLPRIDWIEIKIDTFLAETAEGPTLLLICDDGTTLRFPLARQAGGRIRANLRVGGERLQQIMLAAPIGTTHASFGKLTLTTLPPARIVTKATSDAPAAMLRAGFDRLLGRRLRARNRLHRALAIENGSNVRRWLRKQQSDSNRELAVLQTNPQYTVVLDHLSVFVTVEHAAQTLQTTLDSLTANGIPARHIRIIQSPNAQAQPQADPPRHEPAATLATFADAFATVTTDWIWLIRAGDTLAAGAGVRIAERVTHRPDAHLIYGDHLWLDPHGIDDQAQCVPDWNAALFWAHDYIQSALVSRNRLAQALQHAALPGKHSSLAALLIAITDKIDPARVDHIPRVLLHGDRANLISQRRQPARERRRAAIERCLADDEARVSLNAFGHCRVHWPMPSQPPRVSLIVPTRDRLDLLAPCIEGLRYRTAYPDIEILVADNGSARTDTLNYFDRIEADPRIRIIDCAGPFNYAAINNRAAAAATGTVLGLINNDIDVADPGWLWEMVTWALRPTVGAVGARLLYANGLVQHGGVILGLNDLAGHAHRHLPPSHPGYMYRLQCHQQFSAVTAACLVVERRKFDAVEGFDAAQFPVAFNDVDLCLRLAANGYQTVWTPYARLYHKETASRPRDFTAARLAAFEKEVQALKNRWGHVIADDPHYHPHLTRQREDFTLD